MADRLKKIFTYPNVTATLALVVALGGGAYALVSGEVKARHIDENAVRSRHLARDAATGSDVDEGSLRGIGSGIAGGEWALPAGVSGQTSGRALPPTGPPDPVFMMLAPTKTKISDFRVNLLNEQAQGTRTFRVQSSAFENETNLSRVLCRIEAGDSFCRSTLKVTIPAGERFRFWISYDEAAGPATNAYYGWRTVTP